MYGQIGLRQAKVDARYSYLTSLSRVGQARHYPRPTEFQGSLPSRIMLLCCILVSDLACDNRVCLPRGGIGCVHIPGLLSMSNRTKNSFGPLAILNSSARVSGTGTKIRFFVIKVVVRNIPPLAFA